MRWTCGIVDLVTLFRNVVCSAPPRTTSPPLQPFFHLSLVWTFNLFQFLLVLPFGSSFYFVNCWLFVSVPLSHGGYWYSVLSDSIARVLNQNQISCLCGLIFVAEIELSSQWTITLQCPWNCVHSHGIPFLLARMWLQRVNESGTLQWMSVDQVFNMFGHFLFFFPSTHSDMSYSLPF